MSTECRFREAVRDAYKERPTLANVYGDWRYNNGAALDAMVGWRREHAARVWAAMQAVIAVVGAHCVGRSYAADHDMRWAREITEAACWDGDE